MCGIAGIITLNGKPANPAALYTMSRAIYHRGPDDEGYSFIAPDSGCHMALCGPQSNSHIQQTCKSIINFQEQPSYTIGFAHRRFSIIDLSSAGHQPFIVPHGGAQLIYNGEVYNYKELRAELKSHGYRFTTQSDTEVVVLSYLHWGTGCFSRFNGFWSLALFDPLKKAVIISRDRIGVKPLYYMFHDNSFIFASEMKAIIAVLNKRRLSANDQAISNWLRYGIKDHTHETFFTDIHSFPAGCWGTVDNDGRLETQRYWSIPTERRSEREYSIENATRDLRELLTDAVSVRLRADVPLAIQLSGGLDSSAIAAIARHELNVKLSAYTATFEDPGANEDYYARIVARHCCGDFMVVAPPSGSIWSDIDKFTWLSEEPHHSPNLYTDQQIIATMRKDSIKVTLNGASGDENFCGYRFHYTLQQIHELMHCNIARYINMSMQCKDTPNRFYPFVSPFAYAMVRKILQQDTRSLVIQKRLIQDMTSTLMPYWLVSGDRSYMGIPIEIREPFLDYRIIEFAFRLPITYLIRDGWQKWIVRKTIDPYLPSEIVWRKHKMGNPFPTKSFLMHNKDVISRLIEQNRDFRQIHFTNPNNAWKHLSFLLWKEWYINQNRSLFTTLKTSYGTRSHWEYEPGYFSTFNDLESAG